jgi:hypothetical protein
MLRKAMRINYFCKKETFRRKIEDALGDCIEGPFKYIGYSDPEKRAELKVTLEGRDFIGFGGLFQEFFKRRDKLAMFLFGGGMGFITALALTMYGALLRIINQLAT